MTRRDPWWLNLAKAAGAAVLLSLWWMLQWWAENGM